MDLNRRLRLADSEYFTLKIRAVAFLQEPGAFTSVSSAYDPATDPGSLYNVARRIGASELPAGVTGRGVDVALIDTGVVDVPGLAEADVQIGPDFSFEDVVPELRGRDTMGHGTHLGGIIDGRDAAWSAGDGQRRPTGSSASHPDARLISVKAGAADGAVDVTQIIAAINWVIANKNTDGRNIRVINLSFGTDGVQDYRTDPLSYAVERAWRAGIVVVVAGGNDGWATTRLTNPAQDPFVIAVGSSQAVNGKESVPSVYSNGALSGRTVDLSAPGRSIVSLRNPGSSSDQVNESGRAGERFVRASGTSQAAAVTSASVALLLSARPELTPDQVKQVLMRSAEHDDQDSALVGAGYLRIDRQSRPPLLSPASSCNSPTAAVRWTELVARSVWSATASFSKGNWTSSATVGRAPSGRRTRGPVPNGRPTPGRAPNGPEPSGPTTSGRQCPGVVPSGRPTPGPAPNGPGPNGRLTVGPARSGPALNGAPVAGSGPDGATDPIIYSSWEKSR